MYKRKCLSYNYFYKRGRAGTKVPSGYPWLPVLPDLLRNHYYPSREAGGRVPEGTHVR